MVPLSRRRAAALLVSAGGSTLTGPNLGTPIVSDRAAIALNDGTHLPFASFGVQIYDDETAFQRTSTALSVGFRSFFASIESGNQVGFARAIANSKLEREEVYLSGSVLSDAAVGYRAAYRETKRGVAKNLANMRLGSGAQIDSLDLLLLEYPGTGRESIVGQWRALEDAQAAGLVRSIGVSNFSPKQLDFILHDGRTRVPPVVNQLPYSLAFRQPYAELRQAHRCRGVALQAWSPLGGPSQLISASVVRVCERLGANRGGRTAYQVALRWLVQSGVAFSVHSASASHLQEDLAAVIDTGFVLDGEAMRMLDAISESTIELVV